mmetsp:Transcript_4647/g.6392  ORF Transcript_4647/g.6392 Transcript_4647/m.6392 type:complete len:131 (-) Transcript_4647:237-629(-)|eukprot:CAMPEP_0117756550 /NCGR_PEP_ID=MMETSP0947-20121206/14150_1 /TAXON_ID=44440 /ORGANISM="Chattonella subsalsa, Strain CCMP2191" /LENGTH=130 /DNA_ID=CAMNT_0005576169 /DNA_START=73 /DNA_END=465 /DNA_ORIENTATION=-
MNRKRRPIPEVEIKKAGDGEIYPAYRNEVTVHYSGYYLMKTENNSIERILFDSTITRGVPFKFRIGTDDVIPGLNDGVSQLSKGEHAIITIHPDSGYGETGFPDLIPPNATLEFDLELLDIKRKEKDKRK